MTETVSFRSTNIDRATYDSDTHELTVTFRSGHEYVYRGVPYGTWHGFQHAQSAGEYFHRQIKNRFAFDQQ